MKQIKTGTLIALCSALALAGCSGLEITKPDYDNLPGSGERNVGSGPGLFDSGSKNYGKNGYVVYSNNPDQPALFNSEAKKKAAQEEAAKERTGSAGQNTEGYVPSPSEREQFQQFKEFQAFQHYKEFEDLPDNAKQRKKFEEWKQWDQYKKWKKQNEG